MHINIKLYHESLKGIKVKVIDKYTKGNTQLTWVGNFKNKLINKLIKYKGHMGKKQIYKSQMTHLNVIL